jgi:hypothetical protein
MMAMVIDGKTILRFCTKCHKIHIVGKWQKITKKIDGELKKNFGKWDAELCVCEDCVLKEE